MQVVNPHWYLLFGWAIASERRASSTQALSHGADQFGKLVCLFLRELGRVVKRKSCWSDFQVPPSWSTYLQSRPGTVLSAVIGETDVSNSP